jgi:nucleoside-diphosphate-sugar epimerase
MKILIVGGAGDVGAHLVEDYSAAGHDIRVLDLAAESDAMKTVSGLNYFQGDLADRDLVEKAVEGVDAVIHLAWSFREDPHTIFGTDILGTARLLEAAVSSGVRNFIYASTAVVYGRVVQTPVTEEHPCLIEQARKPFYALGKFSAEKMCLLYGREKGLPVSIMRFWWAYGKSIGGKHLRELIKTAGEGRPIAMVKGAGGAFATMKDLANMISLMIGKPEAAGQTFNAASMFLTWEEIGRMIIEITGSSSEVRLEASDTWTGPAFLNEAWDLSWDKASRMLGYRPEFGAGEARARFKEALRACADGMKG